SLLCAVSLPRRGEYRHVVVWLSGTFSVLLSDCVSLSKFFVNFTNCTLRCSFFNDRAYVFQVCIATSDLNDLFQTCGIATLQEASQIVRNTRTQGILGCH